jgi:predicted DNA-binding transcriptional regulator AlpA
MAAHSTHDDTDAVDRDPAIDTHRAAELLGLAAVTLQQHRARGRGPRFFRVGRSVRYRLADVIAYRDARTVGAP